MTNSWENITPGDNLKFLVNIDDGIEFPVFHVRRVEESGIREYDFGSISSGSASSSWEEILASSTKLLEPQNPNEMFNMRIGVNPSSFVIQVQQPENYFYGNIRGKGGAGNTVYGGTLGEESTWTFPSRQLFNIYDYGSPRFKMYNRGGASATATARFIIDKMDTEFIGLADSWNDPEFSPVNTGVPLHTVSLGAITKITTPGWLERLIHNER